MPIALEPRPTVQLLHDLPDGSSHVDWLLARDPRGEERLITFRLPGRVDALVPPDEMPAERIADHRPRYLDFEGPVPGRGTVCRLARGRILEWRDEAGTWEILIAWDDDRDRGDDGPDRRQRLRLENRPEAGGRRWSVFAVS